MAAAPPPAASAVPGELPKVVKPNKPVVDEAASDDNSLVTMNLQHMEKLGIFRGDTALIKGKRNHSTVCIVTDDKAGLPEGRIRISKGTRRNLRVHLGDVVTVSRCTDIKYGNRIHVLPIDDTVKGLTGDLFETFLKPYFLEAYRPVKKGDCFTCRGAMRSVEFKVVEVETPGTTALCLPTQSSTAKVTLSAERTKRNKTT